MDKDTKRKVAVSKEIKERIIREAHKHSGELGSKIIITRFDIMVNFVLTIIAIKLF